MKVNITINASFGSKHQAQFFVDVLRLTLDAITTLANSKHKNNSVSYA